MKREKEAYESQLLELLSPSVAIGLDGKAYGCGTVNIETDTKTIKVTVGKKIDWDQNKLNDIWHDIKTNGEDPSEYINVKYGVSEIAYKSWPHSISDVFEPARTVTPTKPTIKIEEKK